MTDPLFAELPETERRSRLVFKPIRYPLWTENKARLIARYLYYFVLITKHGAYIDGFTGPQHPAIPESWAAKLVIESEPKLLRDVWLCEKDPTRLALIHALVREQPSLPTRRINIVPGDFNANLPRILSSGRIRENTAAFCLLDQQTFECHWSSLQALAEHKQTNKIELFYFLGTGWLPRAFSGVTRNTEQVERWWGRADWAKLSSMKGRDRAHLFVERFREELGYSHAYAWPIYKRELGGPVMYHMIHATDHSEAPKIMARAYKFATSPPERVEQLELALEPIRKAMPAAIP